QCMFYANDDVCFLDFVNAVNVRSKSKSAKKSHRSETQKPKIKVYSRRPKQVKSVGSSKKAKIVESKMANNSEPTHLWGSSATDVPSSFSLVNDSKFLGTVRFRNDQVAKIIRYGDYQLGNVIISRVYYVEGLGHNLFSVGQFCDTDLEVAFRNTCFIRNLEGVDLLSGSRDTNLYTISLDDMLKTSPISCALGKSKKSSHQPKSEDTNQEKLYLLHMDLCGPMRVESINGKKYILVIVDDYSRFTWVKILRSKDESPDAIIKWIKNIQVRLNATVRNVRTNNGTEFVNQTLRDFYENVSIWHQTFVARTPQQNGIVERRNRTLVEASRTMLIFSNAPLDDWDTLFQPLFDEYFNPPIIAVSTVPLAAAPRAVEIADSLVSTITKTPLFHDDPLHEFFHEDSTSQGSSSNVRPFHTPFELIGRWTKDHPIPNVIGDPSRLVSTRKQLKTNAMWCYFDAFLTSVEPKNFKQAMTEPSWMDAIKEKNS
ncbi:retrovirus-related pol polyprotein from transposon TNT 1-94, partial [Tanacetum coccineum]